MASGGGGAAGGFVTRAFVSMLKECSARKYPELHKAIQTYTGYFLNHKGPWIPLSIAQGVCACFVVSIDLEIITQAKNSMLLVMLLVHYFM